MLVNIELYKYSEEQYIKEINVTFISWWLRGDKLQNRYNLLEAFMLSKGSGGTPVYKRYVGPFKGEQIVPRGTSLVSLTERYFCQSMRPEGVVSSRLIPSHNGTIAVASETRLIRSGDGSQRYSATLYVGPRDYFYLKKAGLEEAFPIGLLGQVGLILLLFLNWIAGITKNYGVAVVLFSVLVTLSMSPLTLMSMRSMKNMQKLKPKVDKILAQHKDDQMKANQEIFALYREHKVSPLSGCLPMALQMPIFIALFQAMSHFIELRGRPFLWAKDLSLPDRLAQLPFSLPLIGRDFNLLPIIMAAAMYIQTSASQKNMASPGTDNPATKMMSGPLMPLLFCLMFYNFPAGLVLYWLTNSLLSLAFYRLVK